MLNLLDLLRAFLRTFFIQSLWNYENMQGTGLAYAMAPIIKKLYKNDAAKIKEILLEYISFFNTNPYLAPGIVGLLISEELKIKENNLSREGIKKIKLNYMGPVAALGDNIIWGKLNTFFIILSSFLFAVFYIFSLPSKYYLASVLIYFLCFNLCTLYFRITFFINGLKKGENFIDYLDIVKKRIRKFDMALSVLALSLIGALTVVFFKFLIGGEIKDKILLNIIGILVILYILGIYFLIRENVKRRYIFLYIVSVIVLIFVVR